MGPPEGRSFRVLTRGSVPKLDQTLKRPFPKAVHGVRAASGPKGPSRVLHPMKPCVKDPTPMKSRKRVIANKFQKAPKRSSRRQVISRSLPDPEAGTLARKNKMTMLERRSVTPAIDLQYGNYYQKYLSFCKDHGLELPPHLNTDINVADYMDLLFLEGRPMKEGEKLVASMEYHNPKLRGVLTRSRRALKGWRKERPPGSRAPLPKLIAYGIAMKFLAAGKREQALKVVLDFDAYMRPGESAPGDNPTSTLVESPFQNVFQCQRKPHKFAVEIFAGTGRVTVSLQQSDVPCFPIDICIFDSHNVLNQKVEYKIFGWIMHHRVSFVWIGMPCTTFSRARKNDGLGPGPLRDSEHLWGLAHLSSRDQYKLEQGNQLFLFTMRLIRCCELYSVPYALENPRTSMVWEMPQLHDVPHTFGAKFVHFDFCQYGELWQKPTTVMYNHIDFSSLQKVCNPCRGFCSRTQRKHIRLAGVDQQNVFWTLRAQPYPWQLAAAVGSLVARALRDS